MAQVRPDRWEQTGTQDDSGASTASPPYAVRLDGSGHPLSLVGGKGASLDRLVRLEFPVPTAGVVTTAAYRAFVDSSVWLQAFLSGLERRALPSPDAADAERDEITAAFLQVNLPADVEAAVTDLVASLPQGARFAVRSSATAEDLTAASFAGQHLSVLNVEGADVLDAVRRVWASLWDPAARAYRAHMAVPSTGLAMGVIVQQMVPADRSGVAFTRDPLDARALRIESVSGLGEALVSGEATPEVVRVARPSLRMLHGGAESPDLAAVVPAVVRAALHVEEELGAPQDIEWSVAEGRVWVLQSRPITTLAPPQPGGDGFDTVARPGDRYSPTGVSEMLPGVLAPLQWSVNGPLLEEAFRRVLDHLGSLPRDLEGPFAVLGRFRGQAALNLTLLEDAARRVGGTDGSEVQRQYLGHVVDVPPPAPRTVLSRVRGLRAAARSARLRRSSLHEAEAFRRAAAAVAGVDLPWSDLRAAELLAARARVRDLAAAGVAAEVAVAVAAVGAYEALEATLRNWVGDDAAHWAQRLTRHAAGDGYHPDPQASRSVYAGPTWAEAGPVLPETLSEHLSDAAERARADLAELERTVMRTGRWRFQRVITGQAVDLRRRAVRRLVQTAAELLAARERTKTDLLRVGGVERRITVELARRLERRGVLADAADVDMLADWELERAVVDGTVPFSQELTRRRRVVAEWQYLPTLPPLVDHRGEEISLGDSRGDALTGWGASPGRHRGRARVVTSSADAVDLEPGDVLVAPATDPSWTPLFLVAGAIVVERGGPLSHAAIVARELGIPAVLNAVGATRHVPDGALVEVDGDRGGVVVLEAP